jgi:hypothetical protein
LYVACHALDSNTFQIDLLWPNILKFMG